LAKVGVTPAEDVYDVLGEVLLALKNVYPAGIMAYELCLYAVVDAEGNLVKEKPTGTAKVKEQLLEPDKTLAGQLNITAADVAGGYFVVKKAPLPPRPLPVLTRTCIAALQSVYAMDWRQTGLCLAGCPVAAARTYVRACTWPAAPRILPPLPPCAGGPVTAALEAMEGASSEAFGT
jgi:hypothetical protein